MIPLIMTNPPALVQKATDWSKYRSGRKGRKSAVTDIFPPFFIIERLHEELERLAYCC